eukprot:GEMP01057367.1.p1 GENE.GEMP01057367.1~~GEMP01057367.1.p1  ORF type:complete len:257 (+),score=63.98 GEMP01057367.1:22-771(+)
MVVRDPSREEIRGALLDPSRPMNTSLFVSVSYKAARHAGAIVRHEAAEALGALRVHCSSLAALADETSAVGQTCLIALKSAQLEVKPCPCQYTSTDPALGVPGSRVDDVPDFARILLDEKFPLWNRYVAMFTLRNIGGCAAVDALCCALLEDTSSALLRHEVAFVLGQMEHERATTALIASLGREEDHSMVRHEAAIALGSIGGEKAMEVLKYWSTNKDELVAESCLVAIETMRYWEEWDALEAQLKNA